MSYTRILYLTKRRGKINKIKQKSNLVPTLYGYIPLNHTFIMAALDDHSIKQYFPVHHAYTD